MCLKEGRYTTATIVDHIVPIRQGGARLDINNLQSLCHSCHTIKSNEEGSSGFGRK
jgi:5-methylcytosine-specific restriction endonuclease McrA